MELSNPVRGTVVITYFQKNSLITPSEKHISQRKCVVSNKQDCNIFHTMLMKIKYEFMDIYNDCAMTEKN